MKKEMLTLWILVYIVYLKDVIKMFELKKNPREFIIDDMTESRNIESFGRGNRFLNISPENYIKVFCDKMPKKSLIPMILISLMDKDNKIYMTLDEFSETLDYPKTGLSVMFVEYGEKDFLVKIRNGLYMINPLVSYKGSKYERDKLIKEYAKHKDSNELKKRKK